MSDTDTNANPSEFMGTWDVTIATPIGKIETVFEINNSDGVVSGMARSEKETVLFTNPVVDGDSMTWSQKVTKPMRLNLNFAVTVCGDQFEGTAKAGRLPASAVSGKRRERATAR